MRRSALLVVALLAAAGLLELVLRTFVAAPAAGSAARFRLDPDLIYRLQPRNEVTWSAAEFTETSRTNALGMRGTADVVPKRPGEVRILAVGDSFTYGHGVQDDETYPAVLERLLRARGHDARVLNAGVPGYSTDQEYAYVLRDGLQLAPDLLLLGVHCSDVSDNYESSLYDFADGRLIRRGAGSTRMYQLGSVVGLIPPWVRRSATFELLVAGFDWHDSAPARPTVADLDAWSYAKMRVELSDVQTRAAAIGTQFAVVLMPCKKALAVAAPDPYGPLARDLVVAGIPLLESATALRRSRADLTSLFFHADPHLNADGDRALAGAIAAFVEEHRLLAGAPRG
jgi:lysophospholipase L1-like esterase